MSLKMIVALAGLLIILAIVMSMVVWYVQPKPERPGIVSYFVEFEIDNVTVDARINLVRLDGDVFAGKSIDANVNIMVVNQSEDTPTSVSRATIELLFENAARAKKGESLGFPNWLNITRQRDGSWGNAISIVPQTSGECGIQLRMTSPEGNIEIIDFPQPIIAESWSSYLEYQEKTSPPFISVLTYYTPFIILLVGLLLDVYKDEND